MIRNGMPNLKILKTVFSRPRTKTVFFSVLLVLAAFFYVPAYSQQKEIHVIRIPDLIIGPVVQEYIEKAIRRATDEKAECLIIELDTPGGLLNTTRTIVRDMMNANFPIVVYVAPSGARAGSAGVFLTLAANVAAMAPSTNIGAAHPVIMGERGKNWKNIFREAEKLIPDKNDSVQEKPAEEESSSPMDQKILNDTLAWVRGIASERGRNVEWAENAVKRSFSETDQEALKLGVIDLIAKDLNDLIQKLDGREVKLLSGTVVLNTRGAEIREFDLNLRQKILAAIANPNVAFILMLLGFYGLLFEFTHPGFGFPGVGGVICLVLAFYAFQTLPVNYAGLILILLGILLFIAEVNVTSYGLLTLGGLISLFFGSLLLIDSSYQFLQVSIMVILPLVIATAAITIFLVTLVIKSQRLKKMSGAEGLIGETGTVAADLNPEGYVFVAGELWRARSTEKIGKGTKVRVLKVEHLNVFVEKVTDQEETKTGNPKLKRKDK